MRVFIGFKIDRFTKKKIIEIRNSIRDEFIKGNYTLDENLHLTLKFIGEVQEDKVEDIKECIESLEFNSFKVEGTALGIFKKRNKAIIYYNINKNKKLDKLYEETSKLLYNNKIIDKSQVGISYKPHITLVRNLTLGEGMEMFIKEFKGKKQEIHIDGITLFESTRIDGKLVYRDIFTRV